MCILCSTGTTNIQVPGPPERKEVELSFQTDSLANIMDREVAMSIHLHGRTIRRNNMRVSEYGTCKAS
ncbi:MAG: hypothetical protein R2830_17895 [Saprospiraceae bacterium]